MTNQKTSLSKAMLLGVGSMLLSEILCLFVAFSCAMLAVSVPAAKWFSLLCTTGIHLGLMADYAVKIAKRDRVEERRFQHNPHKNSSGFCGNFIGICRNLSDFFESDQKAPVDPQHLSGDEGGLLRGKECRRLCHLLRGAEPAQGGLLRQGLQLLRG